MQNLEPIDHESDYREILSLLRQNGGRLDYKTLNDTLSSKFEGVRLRLKTMKDKEIVEFEGIMPSFDSVIRIGQNARRYRF